jgi:PAS domain-containing protein
MAAPQYEVEVILVKQLASYLATPVFVVDPKGDLVYFNEPAEALLGHRYDESGAMPQSEWATIFTPTDDAGRVLPADSLPLSIAFAELRAAHDTFWITGLDGRRRNLAVTAFPLIGQNDRLLGAVAIFWERSPNEGAEA